MFADHIINGYAQQIMTVATEINVLEQRLAQLREQQAALETEKQAMQTLAAAGQSAIDQARQFLVLARNSQEMIDAFWEKMGEIKNEAVIIGELPAADDNNNDIDENDNDTIDVTSSDDNNNDNNDDKSPIDENDDDTIESKTEQVIVNLMNGNGNGKLTEDQFKTYTLLQLRKIAGKVGVKTKQGKDAIALDLEKKNLTQEDVDKILS